VLAFETLDEPARLGGGEGFVERGGLVGVEIVLHRPTARKPSHVTPAQRNYGVVAAKSAGDRQN
jgi:hypothetical protein